MVTAEEETRVVAAEEEACVVAAEKEDAWVGPADESGGAWGLQKRKGRG